MGKKIAQSAASKHLSLDTSAGSAMHEGRHLVFGAGLIGCFVGGSLMHAAQNVSFIGRERFIAQVRDGFTLSDYENNRVKLPAPEHAITLDSTSIDNETKNKGRDQQDGQGLLGGMQTADVIWLTVKCTMVEDAIADMRDFVGENSIIICCQNGVNTHQAIESAFPHNSVIRAMVPFNVVNDETGVFHRGSGGQMTLELKAPHIDFVKWLARQLNTAILPVGITHAMTALQWAKLQLNLGNAVNALADVPVKQMLQTRIYRKFIARQMKELLDVTEKQKIILPKIANLPNTWIPKVLMLPDWLFTLVAQKMLAIDPKAKTSMWWDLHQGRTTEVDYIQGKVLSAAHKLDSAAPANEWIVSLIHQAEQGNKPSAAQFKDAVTQFELEQSN